MVLEEVRAFIGYRDVETRLYNMLGDERLKARRVEGVGEGGWRVRPRRGSTEATIDVVAFNAWPSRGLAVHAIEVKVCRGDWLRELRNPVKTEAMRRNADRIYVMAPEGVVRPDLDEGVLGSEWGWLDERCRVRVESPDLSGLGERRMRRRFAAAMVRAALRG